VTDIPKAQIGAFPSQDFFTVYFRRAAAATPAWTAALSAPPHSPQNLAPGALSNPHFAQRAIDLSGVPQ